MTEIVATSNLSPASQQAEKTLAIRLFGVSDIPAAMRKMNWHVAADLMQYWFDGKPWSTIDGAMSNEVKDHAALAQAPYFNSSIVKMSWLVKFERANKVLNVLRTAWNNEPAQEEMRKKILPKFNCRVPGVYPLMFDGDARSVEMFGYCNSRSVNFGLTDEVDELRAALADFNLRVFPEGEVVVTADKVQLAVSRIGFYVEDAYDFNDAPNSFFSQPLGFWNFDGIEGPVAANAANVSGARIQGAIAAQPFGGGASDRTYKEIAEARYFYIKNSHFVAYRKQKGKGGDFQVFSDVLYEDVPAVVIKLWEL
ncbi:DUF6402 family protein [Pseudomonas protegens]|uniref:DUF6402 family protein n=1 Tax=Pseudomonas protegens TaxID=380021 RepID=UPI001B30A26A|nr:DUF6402 family protein [Pseudomonas protegens]MBP5100518.1 hypothetical protein [Pseudomonas protegens]MBP5126593.1 hypothetical protein [Pseudomonas protegens]QTU06282.1 hypothetical protein HUT25_11190 [Pseudomonas protegens]QTU12592.1 hypothetical protein HUT23_11880 [Pseudomonas protegens]QTU40030.1 hypothetical protein HUT24_20425 [Pseudomonas protegens]